MLYLFCALKLNFHHLDFLRCSLIQIFLSQPPNPDFVDSEEELEEPDNTDSINLENYTDPEEQMKAIRDSKE